MDTKKTRALCFVSIVSSVSSVPFVFPEASNVRFLFTPLMRLTVLMTALLAAASPGLSDRRTEHLRPIEYSDLPAEIRQRVAVDGLSEQRFPEYVRQLETETERRVAEGEREHLIHFALQTSRFTTRPGIEPAVSARRFVEHLTEADRRRFLDDAAYVPPSGWPAAERARVADVLAALARNTADARLSYFRHLRATGDRSLSVDALYTDYVRVARFLYKKEFASDGTAANIAPLYHSRPHSVDTQIEAGFGVYLGLGALHSLEPDRRITRVLIVGPGLDLAPRTDLIDIVAPQTYQPFAVADALLALSMGSEADLLIQSVDVNPWVVRWLQAVPGEPLTLHLFTGIAETGGQQFSADYRNYVQHLGLAIGGVVRAPAPVASDGRYQQSIAVRAAVRRAMHAERLNIVTERLVDRAGFDLVVITNVLTYFDDRQLALALSNIAAMLRPGGYLLHNEARAGLVETAASMQLPVLHMRTTLIGGSTSRPLYDTVWLHQKKRT
jgi:SAM-dependent methyltransferase